MNKPTILLIRWSWDSNQEKKSGRATVIVTYPDMYQRQKTFNFVIGEEVEIYGHYYLVSLDYRSNPKFVGYGTTLNLCEPLGTCQVCDKIKMYKDVGGERHLKIMEYWLYEPA